jgi:hypothetical protein
MPHYEIAERAAHQSSDGWSRDGLSGAVRGFSDACSLEGPQPAHINKNRPLLVWVWALAYTVGGDTALQWVWRLFYILTLAALLRLLRTFSAPPAASILTGFVAAAPVTQGLLAWMSSSTYFVFYAPLLFGTSMLTSGRSTLAKATGALCLFLALLSRDVAYLLVPGAVALFVLIGGRRKLALLVFLLPAARLILMPSEGRAALSTILGDPVLFMRGSFFVAAAESASMVRNLGLLVMLPLLVLLIRKRWLTAIIAVAALLLPHVQLLLPAVLLGAACRRDKWSIPGSVWTVIVVVAMCLYSHFTSRYAFEPLVGLSLALAPALPRLTVRRGVLLIPFVLWHATISLVPDAAYANRGLRFFSELVDQRFRPLHFLTVLRHEEYVDFAGRAEKKWKNREELRLISGRGKDPIGYVWQSGHYWRTGNPIGLRCPPSDRLVFTNRDIWEWNVWYWRVVPSVKRPVIRFHIPGDSSAFHQAPRSTARADILRIASTRRPLVPRVRLHQIRVWLSDIPERNNPDRAKEWLNEVWELEGSCRSDFSNSSFVELELGGLLMRDDGWLDVGELSYLREHARSATGRS